MEPSLILEHFLLFDLLDLHLAQLFVEELCLLEALLLLTDQFSLLEVGRQVTLLLVVYFELHFLFPLSLLLPLVLKLNHLLVRSFQFGRLARFSLLFSLVKTRI